VEATSSLILLLPICAVGIFASAAAALMAAANGKSETTANADRGRRRRPPASFLIALRAARSL
jgi:hypothetical protein